MSSATLQHLAVPRSVDSPSVSADRERLFLRHCFPELAAEGLLIDPSKNKIDTFKEKMVLGTIATIICLVFIGLTWLAEYELFEKPDGPQTSATG